MQVMKSSLSVWNMKENMMVCFANSKSVIMKNNNYARKTVKNNETKSLNWI